MDRRHDFFVSSDGSVESGWTVYLQNSSSLFSRRNDDSFGVHKDEAEEEVDLSMVSDASSGPPIFRENEVVNIIFPENETGSCFCAKTAGGLQKSSRKMKGCGDRRRRHDPLEQTTSFLDDTASSDPNFNSSESSSCQNQFNTISQSSPSGNQRQKNQWFKGKR